MRHFTVYFFLSLLLLISIIGITGCSGIQGTDKNDISTVVTADNEWKIDHAVIVVHNLTASMDKFSAAGFNVVLGGEHADSVTHNALIPFKDGSYLEIFAPTNPAMAAGMHELVTSGTFDTAMTGSDAIQKRFMLHLAEGTGLKDFAISYPGLNISKEKIVAEHGGFVLDGPIPMSRTRPDGIIVRWHVAVPAFQYSTSIPFLIVDDTPRTLRVPDGNLTSHPNGVTGIRSIEIATRDPVAVTRWYDAVLSTKPESASDTQATYMLNGSVIIVRETAKNETEGPVGIVLDKDTGDVFTLENFTIE
ncbi:MAG TPA: VOC family protein [Methanoregulaceae archaeon]|nr:VOC family protein [Methanoregulaceae archaeon]